MTAPDLRRKVRRSLPWSVAAGALQLVLSLVSMVLLVRYLEPAEYGVWAMLGALPATINLVISFGYVEFLIRFVPGIDDPGEVGRVVWSVVFRRMLLSIVVSGLLLITFDLYAARFDLSSYWPHMVVIQVAGVFNLGTLYLTAGMNARFMQRDVVLRTFPAQVLQVLLTLTGILAHQTLLFFVVVAAAVSVLNFAAGSWSFRQRYPMPKMRSLVARLHEGDEQTRYRRLSYIDEWGVSFLSTDISRYLVSYFSNNVEVAIYAVATTIVARLQFFLPLMMLLPLASASFYSRFEQTGDPAELRRMFRFLYDVNNVVSLSLLVAFASGGEELLAVVFRSTYAAAFAPVLILLGFLVLNLMPLGMVVKAIKRPEILIYSKAAVLLNIALGVPLVIHYGATGMAVATAISVAAKNGIMFLFLRRIIGLRIPWRALLRSGAAALVAIAVGRGIAPWLPLAADLALALLVYLVGIRMLRPLDPADRTLLGEMLPGSAGRFLPWVLGR
jgi:O-antigen/teichoic acid export membrane protein